jgi:gluconolactonase
MKFLTLSLLIITILWGCKTTENKPAPSDLGSVEKTDASLDQIISPNAVVEKLGEGYSWSEGPVWVASENMLLFSDVPNNIVYKWTEAKGVESYLTPSGFSGTGRYSNEPGSNGLTLSPDGKLVLCQHGDRRVAFMDAPLNAPAPRFVTLADKFNGKRFSSPNDVAFRKNGDMFFTDPPYGLPKQADDSTKEQPHNGVYKLSRGNVSLICDSLTRPNGIAFLKGEKTVLVANSDSEKAIWYAIDLNESDSVSGVRIFHDSTPSVKAGESGLPDGFRVDSNGNVFATGPGGIWIFNGEGKLLGKIKLKEKAANCALSPDEKTLYITNHMYLTRVKMRD